MEKMEELKWDVFKLVQAVFTSCVSLTTVLSPSPDVGPVPFYSMGDNLLGFLAQPRHHCFCLFIYERNLSYNPDWSETYCMA